MLSTQGCSFEGRNAVSVNHPEGCVQVCFRKSQSLTILTLTMRLETFPAPDPYCEMIFLSQAIEPIFTDFTKSFAVATLDL